MLVLSRKLGESIMIGDNVKVTVVYFDCKTVRLAIEAPREVEIWRTEIYLEKQGAPDADI